MSECWVFIIPATIPSIIDYYKQLCYDIFMASDHDKRYKKLFSHPVIVKEPSIPGKYIPHFSYYKIIENEIPKEVLLKIENVVSAIFYVENSSPEDLRKEINNIVKLLEREQPDIILLFKRWLNNLFQTAKEKWETDDYNEQFVNLMEVNVMFETALKERDEKMIQKGKILDKQNILIKLLTKKFNITNTEMILIQSIEDAGKLDAALESLLFATEKKQVLKCLE